MPLPTDLQKLPPQALDVIRYLNTQPNCAADVVSIMEGTELSERAFGKAIRRLVTRYYVEMPDQGFYALSASGRQAAESLMEYDGVDVPAAASAALSPVDQPAQAPVSAMLLHERRLSLVIPRELVEQSGAALLVGFDAPTNEQVSLHEPGRVILRVSAPGCDVVPVERPIEVAVDQAAGPARFRLTPHETGQVRVKVEAFQLVDQNRLAALGGLYFDLNVSGFPTPQSAEVQMLGAVIGVHPGE